MTFLPRIAAAAFVAAAVFSVPAAQAKDDRMLMDIAAALATPAGHDRFDDTVAFLWADQAYPPPLQTYDIHTTEYRAFAPTRTEDEACIVAFIEALALLRDHAKAVGANAVVDIKSIYRNREFRSDTQFECRAGYVVNTVSLEGRVVKLPEHGISTLRPK
jgi:hypothetical protein